MLNKITKSKLAISIALLVSQSSFAALDSSLNDSQRYIVKFKVQAQPLLKSFKKMTIKLGLDVKSNQPMAAGLNILNIKTVNGMKTSTDIIKQLYKSNLIEYAVKDRKSYVKPMAPINYKSNKPLAHELQWDQFLAPAGVMLESSANRHDGAWQYSMGESQTPVVVAIVDTGVEPNSRLINNFLYDANNKAIGWNFAGNNGDFSDETGHYHGTHVAGTIAAGGVDNFGIGPKLKILPVKIPDSSGMFYESAVINGIYWALGEDVPGVPKNPYPVKVMNMSFGIDEGPGKEVDKCDIAVQEAVDFANAKGAVIVVAAGNNNMEDDLGAPAGCKGTIRISSTGPTGLRAYYSNYGRGVTYAAPGGDKRLGANGGILSTVKPGTGINNSGLTYMQGTSMASPHVAGLFGLVFAYGQRFNITSEQAKKIIYSTTHSYGKSGSNDNSCVGIKSCGHGIIDANGALAAVDENYDFILNSPVISKLALTHVGCEKGEVKAKAKVIETNYGNWQLINNACITKSDLDLPQITTMDFAVTANYGALQYKIYPQGHCTGIGVDGVGCHQ